MHETNPIRRQFPYYGSYAGFYRALWELKDKGLPRRIETRNFAAPSLKNEASRIIAGFTALGWTNEIGEPTDELRKLVKNFGESGWSTTIGEILPKAYPYLSEIALEAASKNDLRGAFISYVGRDAEALRNAETFFLCLAAEAGRPMSESFSRRAARGVGDAQRWLKLAQSGVFEEETSEAVRFSENEKTKTRTSDTSWANKIVELTALLGEGDMTDEEKDAVLVLLAYLARRAKRETK